MKKLHFHYHMDITFDEFVTNHRFTLKCVPKSDGRQEISNLKVDVYPNSFISESKDSFNNLSITGYAPNKHNKFYVDVSGVAYTKKTADICYENKYKVGFYKYHTDITKPYENLKKYFSMFKFDDNSSNFSKAMCITQKLFNDFKYEKNITNINTTAEEAMILQRGVCQDYSHILISLCKMANIAARYVVGLLSGEGVSHAWVEIFEQDSNKCDLGYWIGIDPTNNIVVGEDHIKISCGRDYLDCNINQGIFLGGGMQHQNISVIVYEQCENKENL